MSGFLEETRFLGCTGFDRHQQRVISLAVLADDRENWRPDRYGYELAGCRVSLEFPVAKLLDYETQTVKLAT